MKLRVEIDGEEYYLDLRREGAEAAYQLQAADSIRSDSGTASIVETQAGVYSVLIGDRSFEVRIAGSDSPVAVWVGQRRYLVSTADARDSAGRRKSAGAVGPQDIRAQMPGKVISILVSPGDQVESGQGLIVVEAMKMQNEMRSPKDGIVFKIQAVAGATVAQGEVLMVIE